MSSTKSTAFFVLLLFSTIVPAVQAQTLERGRHWLAGTVAGGGGLHLEGGDEVGALLSGLRIGYGVTEHLRLQIESPSWFGLRQNHPYAIGAFLSPEIFLTDSFFLRPEGGWLFGRVDTSNGKLTTGHGFGAGLAAGFEAAVAPHGAIGPEVRFNYARIGGGNHLLYGILLAANWYF